MSDLLPRRLIHSGEMLCSRRIQTYGGISTAVSEDEWANITKSMPPYTAFIIGSKQHWWWKSQLKPRWNFLIFPTGKEECFIMLPFHYSARWVSHKLAYSNYSVPHCPNFNRSWPKSSLRPANDSSNVNLHYLERWPVSWCTCRKAVCM